MSYCQILVVDDDPEIRGLVSDVLQDEGYSVITAENGADALEQVEQESPDLVLLDMRMPVLDGWGFARALRARGTWLPIVVITATTNASEWAAEIGARAFVAKPFELATLLNTVANNRPPFSDDQAVIAPIPRAIGG